MDSRVGEWRRRLVGAVGWATRTTGRGIVAPRVVVRRTPRVRAVLLSVPMFLAGLLTIYLVFAGWLYPLRPDVISNANGLFVSLDDPAGTWGGPTLAGAWAVHLLIALVLQAACLAVIWWLDTLPAAPRKRSGAVPPC